MKALNIFDIGVLLIYFWQNFMDGFAYYHMLTPKYSFKRSILISCFFLCSCTIITHCFFQT